MQSFLWAIGSLLILVPIIYFLPLGITLRGKWLVIIISFILGLTGLLAKTIFPLWKTILMLLLLMGIVVYFIEKKLGTVLFLSETHIPGNEKEFDSYEEEIEDWEISEKQVEKSSTKEELEVLPENDLEIDKDESFIEPIFEPALPVASTSVEKENEQLVDWDEDISFIQDRNQLLEDQVNSFEEIDLTPKEDSEMAEFEELMEQPLVIVSEDEPDGDQTDTDVESISEYFNSLVEEDNLDKENLAETELDKVFINLKKESFETVVAENESANELEEQLAEENFDLNSSAEPNFKKTSVETQVNQESSASEISMEVDDEELLLEELLEGMSTAPAVINKVEEKEDVVINQVSFDEEPFMLDFESETEEVALEETSELGISVPEVQKDTNKNIEQAIIRKELLNTMVSQLELISKKVDSLEYEELIKEHMHEQLPVHDYYTFASLLISHYIRMKKFKELEIFISSICNKVKGYAILEQELEYIYNRYCEKN
ncbi:hypothetical protein ACWM35_06850 [Neobacillus sp. K501]